MIPDLPLDVYGVIAEFLAGAFAFGTLASLNVANHLIRDETTPVLYETLLLDREVDWRRYRSGDPYDDLPPKASLAYTKYCIRVENYQSFRPRDIGLELPNVVATIIPNMRNRFGRGQLSTLLLHKPVSTFALLGIICQCPVRALPDIGPWSEVYEFVVKTIEAIQDVLLDEDGCLLTVPHHWETNIRVDCLILLEEIIDSSESVLELLALPGRWNASNPRQAMQVGRIRECRLSYGLNGDAPSLESALRGLSEFEFRIEWDVFEQFLDLFLAASMVNPIILGNHIRVQIELCEEYANSAEIAACLPDLEPRLSLLDAKLQRTDRARVLVFPDLGHRVDGISRKPLAELVVECRFDYNEEHHALYFYSEVFDTSARPRPDYGGRRRSDMSRPDFLNSLRYGQGL